MSKRVVIIGGGLAGLAAATALAPRGFDVTLYESRNRFGGRASSFQDVASGQMVDTCQHVSMGCCTNLAHFCRTVGIARFLRPQRRLYFMTPDRRVSSFSSDPVPAPLHLLRSFFTVHHLTVTEKCRIAWGLACLQRTTELEDPPFLEWLFQHRQTQRTIDRFWGLVLISALNEMPDRIGLRYARKVFLDGFMRHRRGFEVEIPSVPLGQLYGEELQGWLHKQGVNLSLGVGVKGALLENGKITSIQLRDDSEISADWFISAVPFDRLLSLLPRKLIDHETYFGNLTKLETSPITSVHCWYDRPILRLPHVVLVDCMGQWVFNRGEVAPGEHYVQVVVSAAREYRDLGNAETQRRLTEELSRLFPAAGEAKMIRCRVVTEHHATFSAVPGVDRWRPQQASPIANLLVAGDWTRTGWPATMEGAVRSGYLAVEALLQRCGQPQRLVQPDLR